MDDRGIHDSWTTDELKQELEKDMPRAQQFAIMINSKFENPDPKNVSYHCAEMKREIQKELKRRQDRLIPKPPADETDSDEE